MGLNYHLLLQNGYHAGVNMHVHSRIFLLLIDAIFFTYLSQKIYFPPHKGSTCTINLASFPSTNNVELVHERVQNHWGLLLRFVRTRQLKIAVSGFVVHTIMASVVLIKGYLLVPNTAARSF
jgi:hypothetical protein